MSATQRVPRFELPARVDKPIARHTVTIGPFEVDAPAGSRVSIDHVRYEQDQLAELTLSFSKRKED